jgi:hypothetical protein
MSYDGLDRLTSANAPNLWGMASYTYDALDNLRSSAVGTRSSNHTYDLGGTNRLLSISTNGSVSNYLYDAQGNITQRGAQGFKFDLANRMSSATVMTAWAIAQKCLPVMAAPACKSTAKPGNCGTPRKAPPVASLPAPQTTFICIVV